MMNRILVVVFIGVIIFNSNCQPPSEYEQMVKKELAKGVRQDSLFLGFYFGMSSKDFYDYCWQLNREQKVREGLGNTAVQYDISTELRHAGKMNFYPTFFEDKIYEMPVQFNYDAFVWSSEFSNDTLLVDVLGLLGEWYGDFKAFSHPEKETVYVNINSNRQIRVFKDDLKNSVQAIFTDLSVDKDRVKAAQTSSN